MVLGDELTSEIIYCFYGFLLVLVRLVNFFSPPASGYGKLLDRPGDKYDFP